MSESDMSFFVLLARHESFVETARELGVTASAVSRRLARLEDRLGVRLMNRTTRRVSLTGEGEVYFAKAVRLLGEIEELESSLRTARERPSGLLRINATFGFSRAYIAPTAALFSERYPDVDVQLVVSDAPLNIIEQGFDLNIRFGHPPSSNLVQRLLHRNRRFMCASASYIQKFGSPKVLKDLSHHDCIVLRQEHDIYDIWKFEGLDGESASVRVNGRLSTNDGEMAREWMLGGRGIMLRSEWDIASHVREGRIRVILPDYFQTANILAIYPERHNLTAKVRLFVDALAECIQSSNAASPFQITNQQLHGPR
ncbi:LysR family transcriptional regulator [Roseibium suaedae]|uniref:Transcriptional regulator, LysR family n=1 Tax=Roseibium suaedae TaxID=735517 RepID=A0A1M7NTL5_9HYPH|nr:LysR family transcriptional regulator [Roseibium suaedae]SHN07378.1 transcriptional regulator, LysR family [Roseibium suaedae]